MTNYNHSSHYITYIIHYWCTLILQQSRRLKMNRFLIYSCTHHFTHHATIRVFGHLKMYLIHAQIYYPDNWRSVKSSQARCTHPIRISRHLNIPSVVNFLPECTGYIPDMRRARDSTGVKTGQIWCTVSRPSICREVNSNNLFLDEHHQCVRVIAVWRPNKVIVPY